MMYVSCECGNGTFHIRWEPPLRAFAECTECDEEREIGGDDDG